MSRSSGILLHPTSLPGRFGIGDLGPSAYRFIDFLTKSGQHLWQVLPLGPTGLGDSPYTSFSAFAGNPLLISPETLVEVGHLTQEDLYDVPVFPAHQVDYGSVKQWKNRLFERAYTRFMYHASPDERSSFEQFCVIRQTWLEDFALFMALLEAHDGRVWSDWPFDIATRQPQALSEWGERLADRVSFYKYVQYLFHIQWTALKRYAFDHTIELIGDIPIFVAHNSVDVWAHPELFWLDSSGTPSVVAGVPPDYFSETGQRWGNPLYRWDDLAARGYTWWIERLRTTLAHVDRIRVDHFRGFESYWEIPADEPTAIKGRWVPGPGAAFFHAVHKALGPIPIIAEDLGLITSEVQALRDALGFPGMKVLQFGFGSDAANTNLPHNFPQNCVAYTGTHDNDTTVGWYQESGTDDERTAVLRYLGIGGDDFQWSMIRLAFASVADTAIIPLQDVMGLGSEGRMNIPGKPDGNWTWRYTDDLLTDDIGRRLHELTEIYGRHVFNSGE